MNSRERIKKVLNHEKIGSIAIDFGGMRSTGISAIAYNKLLKYLGIKNKWAKVYDIFQQLAEPDIEVVNILGGDVVQAHKLSPAFGVKIDRWKESKLQDGSKCWVPYDFNPKKNSDDDLELYNDQNQVIAKMPDGGLYFDQVIHPYENVQSKSEMDKISIPQMSEEDIKFMEEEVNNLYLNTDKAILLCFGGSIFEQGQLDWGYENIFINMAINKELIHYYLERLTQAHIADLKKLLPRVASKVNVIQFGDDLGTQIAPQISVEMFREMYKPYYKRIFGFVRENYPNVKVFMHSCGAIYKLIPDLIDAGVEILNPVQISAQGMDPEKLKSEFGQDLIFWGGGADMQTFVDAASIEEIKTHVKNLIEVFNKNNGYVFSQVHNILANVEPEKIVAIYETALKYK